jgi:dTDP-4-dehydrorhamnose 3,5-epimerase
MHFQRVPKFDAKLVRCTMGHIHDLIVVTRGQIYVNQLADDIAAMLYVHPASMGFKRYRDDAIIEYPMGVEYVPDLYRRLLL